MKKKSEHQIQNEILMAVSKHDCTVFRTNAGKIRTVDGRTVMLLPKGFPDCMGFVHSTGKIFFIEVKNAKGKPRKDQIRFHKMLQKYSIIHGLCRSKEDAIKVINGELVGYGFKQEIKND